MSTASGFHRTEDGGVTWVQSISGLDRGWAGDLAVMPGAPDALVLACARREPGEEAALFRSANGGLTWTRSMLDGEDEWEQLPLLARLSDSDDTLFTAAGDKLWGSHDAGRSWVMLADGLTAGAGHRGRPLALTVRGGPPPPERSAYPQAMLELGSP